MKLELLFVVVLWSTSVFALPVTTTEVTYMCHDSRNVKKNQFEDREEGKARLENQEQISLCYVIFAEEKEGGCGVRFQEEQMTKSNADKYKGKCTTMGKLVACYCEGYRCNAKGQTILKMFEDSIGRMTKNDWRHKCLQLLEGDWPPSRPAPAIHKEWPSDVSTTPEVLVVNPSTTEGTLIVESEEVVSESTKETESPPAEKSTMEKTDIGREKSYPTTLSSHFLAIQSTLSQSDDSKSSFSLIWHVASAVFFALLVITILVLAVLLVKKIGKQEPAKEAQNLAPPTAIKVEKEKGRSHKSTKRKKSSRDTTATDTNAVSEKKETVDDYSGLETANDTTGTGECCSPGSDSTGPEGTEQVRATVSPLQGHQKNKY